MGNSGDKMPNTNNAHSQKSGASKSGDDGRGEVGCDGTRMDESETDMKVLWWAELKLSVIGHAANFTAIEAGPMVVTYGTSQSRRVQVLYTALESMRNYEVQPCRYLKM